jgi:hypothetical protein
MSCAFILQRFAYLYFFCGPSLTRIERQSCISLLIILLEVWSVAHRYAFNPPKVRFHPSCNVFFLAIDPVISQPNLSFDSLDPSPQRLGDDGIQVCRTPRPSSPLTLAGIDASSRRTYQRLIPLCCSSPRWLKSTGDTEGQGGGCLPRSASTSPDDLLLRTDMLRSSLNP